MDKNNKGKTILIVVIIIVVLIIAFFFMRGMGKGRTDSNNKTEEERTVSELLPADKYEKVDAEDMLTPYDEINAIYRCMDENDKVIGYVAFMTVDGYGGPMNVNVATDEKGEKVVNLRVGDNNETEGLGALATEEAFYGQFSNVNLPVALRNAGAEGTGDPEEAGNLQDGTYKAEADEYSNDFKSQVELTIKDGRIVSVNWDELKQDGESKKNLSIKGEYNMTETGPKWHEQAEQMENTLLEVQDPMKIEMNNDGKTDAISSVSISINNFVKLAQDCIDQARGVKATEGTHEVEAISGATVTSTAVVNAANIAADFISQNLNK